MGASVGGGSVDRAFIKQQAGRRISSIGATCKTMQHTERPVRSQAIDYSLGLRATEVGRTVQIAGRVSHQPTVRALSAGPTEAVQDGFLVSRVDPKDDSLTGGAAGDRRAVQVARRIEDEASRGRSPVRTASKAVEHVEGSGGINFKDNSSIERAAPGSCAVQVARRVANYAARGQ